METLILLGIIALVVCAVGKGIIKGLGLNKPKITEPQAFEPKIEVSFSTIGSDRYDVPDTGPLAHSDDGWILNPRSPFPLTIYGIDKEIIKELKRLLDSGYSLGTYAHSRVILPIVFNSNFRCKEIEEYIGKFKPQYLAKIEEMKKLSIEWESALDNDKEDMLCDFRNKAIESLDIRPYCDIETLFEGCPPNVMLNPLIDKYGYEIIQLYIKYSGKVDKINVIPADHFYRSGFEKMTELGLARRGKDIPTTNILENLKLKEMNELVSDLKLSKLFRRKAEAVQFLANLPDIQERLGKIVTFRELFQLRSLFEENNYMGLDDISLSQSLNYSTEIATLIAHTYVMGGYSARNMRSEQETLSYIEYFEISPVNDGETCPYCKRAASKKYSKRQYPKVPLHIGCRCGVLPKLK